MAKLFINNKLLDAAEIWFHPRFPLWKVTGQKCSCQNCAKTTIGSRNFSAKPNEALIRNQRSWQKCDRKEKKINNMLHSKTDSCEVHWVMNFWLSWLEILEIITDSVVEHGAVATREHHHGQLLKQIWDPSLLVSDRGLVLPGWLAGISVTRHGRRLPRPTRCYFLQIDQIFCLSFSEIFNSGWDKNW